MKSKLNVLLSGVDEFAERTSMAQQASEIIGVAGFKSRIQQHYKDIAGWHEEDAMDLDSYGMLPEWAQAWYPGVVHQMFLEREGWFKLAGQRLKMCEVGRFSNRFEAYEYLSRGERVICVASSAKYWALLVWDDTPEDISRLKAEGKWKICEA